ncbi:hypothetical protein A4X09_0g1442 [Tilletia walkeri]|uniref:Uncharacterized protein n=1 Tax=Tilletia walkeri TaxID=117179 RepID=A0A8X7T809_9BASI|nr:hypothetical protein A4X09_0g1442 [Tilletia walkeri]
MNVSRSAVSGLARQQFDLYAAQRHLRLPPRTPISPLTSQPGLRLRLNASRPFESVSIRTYSIDARQSDPQSPKHNRLQASLAQIRSLAQQHGSDPASLVASFLVLHELTALIPLLLLFWLFELLGAGQFLLSWLGTNEGGDHGEGEGGFKAVVGGWVNEGIRRAEKVGRRYGLFGMDKTSASPEGTPSVGSIEESEGVAAVTDPRSGALVGSFANAVAAYACVKALIPLRLAASVALAPAFARYTIEPIKRIAARWRGTSASNPRSAASSSPSKPSKPE